MSGNQNFLLQFDMNQMTCLLYAKYYLSDICFLRLVLKKKKWMKNVWFFSEWMDWSFNPESDDPSKTVTSAERYFIEEYRKWKKTHEI